MKNLPFLQVLKLQPDSLRASYCLGRQLQQLGRLHEANAAFLHARDICPDNQLVQRALEDLASACKDHKHPEGNDPVESKGPSMASFLSSVAGPSHACISSLDIRCTHDDEQG